MQHTKLHSTERYIIVDRMRPKVSDLYTRFIYKTGVTARIRRWIKRRNRWVAEYFLFSQVNPSQEQVLKYQENIKGMDGFKYANVKK